MAVETGEGHFPLRQAVVFKESVPATKGGIMADIKKVEFKSVCVLSVFKYFGGIFLLIGLIIGLFANLLRINVATSEFVKIFPFMANLTPGVSLGIAFALIHGISAGMGFSVLALIYNFFAGILGGIKFYTKEE